MSEKTILAIEDEEDILEVIEYNLQREGYNIITTKNGQDGLDLLHEENPDLVLLDLMLPDVGGIEICKQIRSDPETQSVPVIMVTAKDTDSDIILGLGVGADDYVTKPFNPKELTARVKSVLRRTNLQTNGSSEETLKRGPVTIIPDQHKVKVDGEPVEFTATEFGLLYFLASSPGRVYSRDQLIDHVLGNIVTTRNIDVHIRAIRKKLGDHEDLIETVRGVGYRFKEVDT